METQIALAFHRHTAKDKSVYAECLVLEKPSEHIIDPHRMRWTVFSSGAVAFQPSLSLLFSSFLSSKSLHLSSTLHTFSFGSGLCYPTTTHSLLFLSLPLSSSFSLPSSCSPFNLPGLQRRRGRGNSMVTWHPAISLHCQLILAYRHAAVPCQPTSHHAPDIPRPVYRAAELQST